MITLSRLFRSLPSERRVAPTVAGTPALCAAAVVLQSNVALAYQRSAHSFYESPRVRS